MPNARSVKAPSWRPGFSSALLERLDVEGDGDLVAEDDAAALERSVEVDAELLAAQDDRCLEASDFAVAHAGVDAIEFQLQLERLGEALAGGLAVRERRGTA